MAFPPSNPSPSPDDEIRAPEPYEGGGLTTPAYAGFDDSMMDAWTAEPEPQQRSGARLRRAGWELAQTLILALLIFLAVRAMAQNFRVEGSSMEPGLHDGQYLLVNKAIYFEINLNKVGKYLPFIDGGDNPYRSIFRSPHRGDVVVFRYPKDPDRDFIKRIIAVPGDTVRINNGVVYVNGVRLEEPYIDETPSYDFAEQVVPDRSYFVLGDNRSNSFDSHAWGFVPKQNIIGQAVFSYWPTEELGGVGNTKINLGIVSIPIPSF